MIHPFAAVFASAALAYAATFILTRRVHISFWSFFGTFLYEWPKILLLFGVSNLETLLLFNYTAGVVLIPLLLVALNFIFIQLNLFIRMRFILKLIHRKKGLINTMRIALLASDGIRFLQKHNVLPKQGEAKRVYLAGVIAGLVRLSVYLYCGL